MSIVQGTNLTILVKPELSSSPVTGLDNTGFTVMAWWQGLSAFQAINLDAEDVVEISPGHYSIALDGVTAALGILFLQISGAFDLIEKEFEVIPTPINTIPDPSLCVISGNVLDIGGNPGGKSNEIIFRPVSFPKEQDGSLISADSVITFPDVQGNFSVSLIRGQEVTVQVSNTGLRVQFTVPDQETANLVDVIPPIS